MISALSVEKRECPHNENHSRKLTQEQDGIKYEIDSCDICADIALKADADFVEVTR